MDTVSCQTPTPPDLAGRVAVVTGAARGIGRAIAELLHEAGARVAVVDRDEEELKRHFAHRKGCECIVHDLSEPDALVADGDSSGAGDKLVTSGEALAEKVVERMGEVPTLVVNNAGVGSDHGFLDLDGETYDRLQRVNFRTPLFFTQHLVKKLPQVAERRRAVPGDRRAAIVFISSVHDRVPVHRPAYSTSKAAVAQLTRELAVSLGGYGIRVNAISPGWIRTDPDPGSEIQQAKERSLVPQIAAGRPGAPEDVARQAVLLLSDWSGYVTGVNLPVDGGLALNTWMPPPGVRWDQMSAPGSPVGNGHAGGDLEVEGGVRAAQDHAARDGVGGGEQQDQQGAPLADQGDHDRVPSRAGLDDAPPGASVSQAAGWGRPGTDEVDVEMPTLVTSGS